MYDNLSIRLRDEAKVSDASPYIKELMREAADALDHFENLTIDLRRIPVVWCRECKYREVDNFCTGRGWPKQMVADDGFCEKGKRKDGDGE